MQIQVEIYIAWWFPLYLRGLLFFCQLHGSEPDMVKVERMVQRAIRTRLAR